jgi:hypothetical protein
VVPDAIPFVDEALLALLTVIVGSWRTRRQPPDRADGDDTGTPFAAPSGSEPEDGPARSGSQR